MLIKEQDLEQDLKRKLEVELELPLLEEILGQWETKLGPDYRPYKNHVYRMVHFCLALRECTDEEREKIIIAGCFHDIGIWTDDTWDYLPPSILALRDYLKQTNREAWFREIELMVDTHHQVTEFRDTTYPLVELFRRADLVDVTLGLVKWGLPGKHIQNVKAAFPNFGFHKLLLQLSAGWFFKHPLNPMPMMKW